MKKKVYCKDCKYFKGGEICKAPENSEDTSFAPNYEFIYVASSQNGDNDCEWYERKWWKYWIP